MEIDPELLRRARMVSEAHEALDNAQADQGADPLRIQFLQKALHRRVKQLADYHEKLRQSES
jgi:hypothetical protein